MSTSGTYHYWPKVANPNAIIPQMDSDTQQPPFFFGGSQVPTNLGIHTGSGIRTNYISHIEEMKNLNPSSHSTGKGISTTVKKGSKIYLPKFMKSI